MSQSWTAICMGLLSLTVFVSCGSKTSANKSNFKAAIQAELDKAPVCIVAMVPREVPGWNGQLQADKQLDVLVNVGLVKRSETMVQRGSMDMAFGGGPKSVQGYKYDFSDSGKKYIAQVRTLMGSSPELCYGKKAVVEVVRYTEPSAAMGMTITEVSYKWKLQDVADWAKNPDVEKTYFTQQGLSAAEIPEEATMALVLSNDGWHAPH